MMAMEVAQALMVEQAVQDNGTLAATFDIIGGRIKVGLDEKQITHLGKAGQAVIKTSCRGLPFIVSQGKDGGICNCAVGWYSQRHSCPSATINGVIADALCKCKSKVWWASV